MIRALGLTVLFVLVVGVIIWMRPDPSANPQPAPAQYAPLRPEGETPVAADESFREACFKSIGPLATAWTFNEVMYTRSKEWGLVLRADYINPDMPGPNVNRVVCSRGADGKMRVNVTMGQKIPPLSAPK
ncbi:MAG: hypothetical protein AB7E79_05975 [Rhodospirillaceae bacterium]